jgi:hypothetical protein
MANHQFPPPPWWSAIGGHPPPYHGRGWGPATKEKCGGFNPRCATSDSPYGGSWQPWWCDQPLASFFSHHWGQAEVAFLLSSCLMPNRGAQSAAASASTQAPVLSFTDWFPSTCCFCLKWRSISFLGGFQESLYVFTILILGLYCFLIGWCL